MRLRLVASFLVVLVSAFLVLSLSWTGETDPAASAGPADGAVPGGGRGPAIAGVADHPVAKFALPAPSMRGPRSSAGLAGPGADARAPVLAAPQADRSRQPEPGSLAVTRRGRRAAGPDATASRSALPAPPPGRQRDGDALGAPAGQPIHVPAEAIDLLALGSRALVPAGPPDAANRAGAGTVRAAPWTADQLLANPTHMNDEYVAVEASGTTGNLFAVFAATDLGGGDRDIYIARSVDLGQTWTTVKMPTFSLDESMPDLAIDAAGYLYVVWVRSDGVLIRARSAGPEDIHSWAYVQAFVVGEPIAVPSIAVSGAGDFARVFIACSWYTVNWDWWQHEYTLLWLFSTNGGQTVAYDYLLPDGHQDLWPVVAMHGATVYMVNGEQDPYTGRIRILAAADALSGSFADYIDLTQGSPMSNGFPSVAADGPNVHVVYQLDWDAGPGGIDGDVMYVFSWDGLATAYGPYAIMATTSESVGPQITTRGGLVGCVWLEAPAGGDEFHLAARQAPLDGHPDYWGGVEQVTDLPMVVPQFRAAAVAAGGALAGGAPAGPLAAVWMDRRDFAAQGFNLYTSRRPLMPNLVPFTPPGWQSPLVVSMVPGQREDGPIAAGYPAYASLAVANLGLAAAAGPVAVELKRGSELLGAWNVPGGLPAGAYAAAEDQVVTLPAGLHTLHLRVDPAGTIPESDETDNVHVKDVWVLSGDPHLALSPSSLYLAAEGPDGAPLALRSAEAGGPVIEARLQDAMSRAGATERLRVVVGPSQRPDPADLARRGRRGARRALEAQVARYAAAVAPLLAASGKGGGGAPEDPALRPLWLSGELAGRLTSVEIEALAASPEVGLIWLDDQLSERYGAGGEPVAPRNPARRLEAASPAGGPSTAAYVAAVPTVPWHLQMLGAPDVWAAGFTGSGVLVGHTDSGVAWDHPDLAGRLWDGLPDYPHHGYDFLDDDLDPYDDGAGGFWHGTHTAGLIVSAGHGVAPGARVLVTRCVPGYYQDLVAALQFCLDHGCHVISTSAGWTQPGDALRSANRSNAEIMLAMGVPWIVAAGNGDNQGGHLPAPHDISSPGDSPEPAYGAGGHSAVIAVGAVAQNAQLWSSSSLGPAAWNVAGNPAHADYPYPPGLVKPDLVAPGVSVTSTIGGGGHAAYSGTSMATPLVAGATALLLQANPTLAPANLAEVLATTSQDLGAAGRDNQFGAGLVDLPAALAALPANTTAVVWARNVGAVPLLIESISTAAGWLQPLPASGAVAPGDSLRVNVTWDASGLAEGIHQATIAFVSNDPRGTVQLPVVLTVGQVAPVQDLVPAPAAAALSVYPNPFNPATTVRFDLPVAGHVTLRVFDARGRLVRDLLRAQRPAGRHEAAWDGRDETGRACAAGVYLVRLASGDDVRVGRMLLVR